MENEKIYDVSFNYPGHNKQALITVIGNERIEDAIKRQFDLTYGQYTNIVIYKKKEV